MASDPARAQHIRSRLQQHIRRRQAKAYGERRQQERLQQELRQYPAARCTERGPHQDLPLPRRRASKHQEGDVAADDNQQQDGERVDRVDAGLDETSGESQMIELA